MAIWDWSQTAANNDSVGSINWAEGQVPGSVNNSARAEMADVAEWRDDTGGGLTLAGGTTAYTLTLNGTLVTPVDGVRVHAVCNATNTGASTLNVDGTGAKAIKKVTGSGEADVAAGNLVANAHYIFEYDASANSAAGAWIVLNPNVPSGPVSSQTFTSSGTWTRPDGITSVLIEVQGAGGGGGGAGTDDSAGAGGGGGGYAKALLDVTAISSSTITVGAVGTGGAAGNNAGTAGGNSSWADGTNTITANGGAGGQAGNGTGGDTAGGTATGGDVNITGGSGTTRENSGAVGLTAGGHSVLGFGAPTRAKTSGNSNGVAGAGFGGGGNGGHRSTTNVGGGNGSAGIVIVWEYA